MCGAVGARPTPAEPAEPPALTGRPALLKLQGACPRCGAPGLFVGVGRLAEGCSACGLDFRRWEGSPRLIGLLTLAVTLLLLGLALGVDRLFRPPLWTILLWGPLSALLLLGVLHGLKGMLLARRYRAAERAGKTP